MHKGYHNLNMANHQIPDPLLTPLGEEQCAALSKAFPYHDRTSKVIASPLRRTIYTALIALEPAISSKKLKVIALPEAQETSDVPCDTGSDPEVLRREIKESKAPVDLSLVKDGWNDKRFGGKWAPTSSAISARAREARRYIRDLIIDMAASGDDSDIALVSHGGYLHYFTEDWEDSSLFNGTGWANTEYRSYTFQTLSPETPSATNPSSPTSSTEDLQVPPPNPNSYLHRENSGLVGFENDFDNATLIETPESRTRRGKTPNAPTRKEQNQLFAIAMQGWESQGLQNPSKLGEVNGEVVVSNSTTPPKTK